MTKNCNTIFTTIAGALLMAFAIGCSPPEKDIDVSVDTGVAETDLGSGTSSNMTESTETPDNNTTTGSETPAGETPAAVEKPAAESTDEAKATEKAEASDTDAVETADEKTAE